MTCDLISSSGRAAPNRVIAKSISKLAVEKSPVYRGFAKMAVKKWGEIWLFELKKTVF